MFRWLPDSVLMCTVSEEDASGLSKEEVCKLLFEELFAIDDKTKAFLSNWLLFLCESSGKISSSLVAESEGDETLEDERSTS